MHSFSIFNVDLLLLDLKQKQKKNDVFFQFSLQQWKQKLGYDIYVLAFIGRYKERVYMLITNKIPRLQQLLWNKICLHRVYNNIWLTVHINKISALPYNKK